MLRLLQIGLLSGLCSLPLQAQLPAGPGSEETERLCKPCHGIPKAVSLRQDRNGWAATLQRMVGLGMEAAEPELLTVLEYLTKHYPVDELPPININKARAIQLESRFSLKRSEAAAILRYRKEHGGFQSLEDILKVPGIDAKKLEARKDQIIFE